MLFAGHARERLCSDDPRLLTAPSISSDTPCPLRVSPASRDAPLHLRVSPANGDAPRPLRVSPVSGDTPSRLRVSPASSDAPRPLSVSPASGDTPSRLRVSPESGDAPSLPDSAVVHRCYGDHGCAALLGDGQRAGGRREGNGGLAAGERMNRNGLDRARMTGSESPAASDSLTWLAARGVVSTAPTTSSGAPGAGRDPPTAGRDPASLGRSPSVGRSDPVVAGAGYTGLYRLPAPGRLYGGDQLHTTATTTAPGYPSVYTGPTALSPFGAYLYPYRAYPPHPESFSAVLHNISTQHAHQVVPPPPPPPPAQFLAPHAPHAAPAGFKAETRHSPDGYRTGPATSRKHHMLVAPRPEPAATARHHSEPPPAKRHRTTPQPAPSPGAPPPALPPPPPLQPALVPPRPSCRPHYPPHFHRGSVIELASGQLKRVEELRTDDFIGSADVSDDLQIDSSTVTRIEPQPERATASLGFSVGENHVQVRGERRGGERGEGEGQPGLLCRGEPRTGEGNEGRKGRGWREGRGGEEEGEGHGQPGLLCRRVLRTGEGGKVRKGGGGGVERHRTGHRIVGTGLDFSSPVII